MTTPTAHGARTLADLAGTIVLVGAGKMGGAMLDAWLGRGITVAARNARVSRRQRALVHTVVAATGLVEWVTDEGLMDAITAVSGSGPAYVSLLVEALTLAGTSAGLPPELAAKLARATV